MKFFGESGNLYKRKEDGMKTRQESCNMQSPFVQQCAQEYPRLSPEQKFVVGFTLDPKGDEA